MYNSTDWWQTPLGHYLLAREQAFFDQAVADVFGFNAVQIEMPQLDSLRMNRMPKRIRLRARFGHVRADAAALPLGDRQHRSAGFARMCLNSQKIPTRCCARRSGCWCRKAG